MWQGRRKFDLFPERDEAVHGAQRRLVARPYSMDALKDLEPFLDDALKVFFKRMDDMQGQNVDLGEWIQLFAFDVIGEVTFSKRFGFMDVGRDDGSFDQITNALRSASWLGQVPWLYWLHDYLSPYLGNYLAITARHGGLRNFAVREIAARQDRGSDHQDILSKLFAIHAEKPNEFDDNAVISMATSNIFAGSDTTAISTRAVIYYLLKNPESMQKLLAEIAKLPKQGKSDDPISLEQALDMRYLQAVLYEALRLHPAVGMSLPRLVPVGGFEAGGHFFPAGVVLGANPWVVHQDKDIYGEDADQFRPERWLQEDVGDMHRNFLTFGAGARMCIGRNIGWMEMSKLVPTFLSRYQVRLTEPDAVWSLTSWWFVAQRGLNVTFRKRQTI